jgi:hypothetical protein
LGKSGTADYLKLYFDKDVALRKIYRYLDKLYNTQQEAIQQISVEHNPTQRKMPVTVKRLQKAYRNGKISKKNIITNALTGIV